jgi:hypothetical protein
MEIPGSDEQPANAESPTLAILQPDSNVNSERLVQFLKQLLAIVSIDEGIQID